MLYITAPFQTMIIWKGAVISNIAYEHFKRSQSEFVVDVRKKLRSIWNQANQLGNDNQTDKAAKYHNWVALPLRSVTVDGPTFSVPRYLHLNLGRQTQCNVAHSRLHSHTLRVETRSWEHHVPVISVACRLFKTKDTLFSCVLACKCVL